MRSNPLSLLVVHYRKDNSPILALSEMAEMRGRLAHVFAQAPVEAALVTAGAVVVVGARLGGAEAGVGAGGSYRRTQPELGPDRALRLLGALAAVGLALGRAAPVPALRREATTADAREATASPGEATAGEATARETTAPGEATTAGEAAPLEEPALTSLPSAPLTRNGHQKAAQDHQLDALKKRNYFK